MPEHDTDSFQTIRAITLFKLNADSNLTLTRRRAHRQRGQPYGAAE